MISFQPNCWSEYDPLEVVLLCTPASVSITNQENANMVQSNAPIHHEKAAEQHHHFKATLKQEGVEVIDVEEQLSDDMKQLSSQLVHRTFVRDIACVIGNKVIPGVPGVTMRSAEYDMVHKLMEGWFSKETFLSANQHIDWVRRTSPLEFGDVFILNKDAVFINVGKRSSEESVARLLPHLKSQGFSEVGIIDLPHQSDTLHLDMNCNVAGEDIVVAKQGLHHFPVRLITESTHQYMMMEQFLMRHGFEVIWVDKYAAIPDFNFLTIHPEAIVLSKNAKKSAFRHHDKLKHKKMIEVDVNELEKGGGGIRCMTLPLRRALS
ncbi:arginine deiminase family protein [Longirhabdus pacifica]|uniref:arginine deiminase family protein n=1 Tax=Longirhabdus pacifica TaxID=2305227 RepID=UPI001008E42E|nr:arginine deiminase family protein [Longirhabdus pacifica]